MKRFFSGSLTISHCRCWRLPPVGAWLAMAMHSRMRSRGTARVRSSRRRTERVVVSNSSGVMRLNGTTPSLGPVAPRMGQSMVRSTAKEASMITRFGSLYAGHVDLDGHGLDATPVNERWLPDEQLVTVFDKATAIATLMDRTGYDVFWLAEHHFQREGYEVIPNILMLSVHLAHLTRRIKFGCGFNIVPMWHPLR